ncbi:hypothetical protein MUP77_22160 [Candidatus Bathyarchaeota archaeon]|nr:hypothetical protein [Candidatus Bathyarchaeota archaeon]
MNSVQTRFPGRIRAFDENMLISVKRRDQLVDYCQQFVKYEEEASFNGIKIRLRTNIEHINDFWIENWYVGCPDIRNHAEIYTIDDGGKITAEDIFEKPVEKPEINAGAVYNPETKTTIVLNTDYYGETKPTSLAMAADILEDRFGVLSVHGASAAIDGKGYLLIGPTNAGKTTHSYGPIFYHPKGEFHQDDWIFVRFFAGKAFGCASERKFYMRTNSIQNYPWLEAIFRENKLENITPDAPRENFLPGLPRVMVDPKHIVSPEKVVNEVRIFKTFLLSRNPKEKMVIRSLEPEEAVEILRNAPEKWHNNYLTTFGQRKDARRAELFKKLFEVAEPYLVNTVASVEKIRNIIIKVATS